MAQETLEGEPLPLSAQMKRPLPDRIKEVIEKRGIQEDDLTVATETDLDITGEYLESWVLANKEWVLVYRIDPEDDTVILSKEIQLKTVEKVRMDTRVGSGFIEAKINGVYEELARFSNTHAEKFSKVVAQLRSLAGGRVVVKSEEEIERAEAALRAFKDSPHLKVRRGTVFFRFLSYTKVYWPYSLLAMALVVLTIVFLLLPQQLVKVLVDQVLLDKKDAPDWFLGLNTFFGLETKMQWLYMLVGLYAMSIFLAAVVGVFRESLAVWINNRLGFDLRREVFQKFQDLAIRYHEMQPVGQLMTRCSQDVETLQAFINQITSGFGFQLLLVVGVGAAMFSMNWYLALIVCVPAPFVMACTILFSRWVTPKWRKYWSRRSDLNTGLHSVLSGIRVVKAFAQEGRESNRFGRISGKFRDIGLSVGYANSWFYPLMFFVFQLGSYFVWIYGGRQILGDSKDLTVGELIAFLGYLGMFYAPLNSLTQMSTWFTQFTTQAHRVFEVLDQEPEIRESETDLELEIQGDIEFKQVSFGYDPHIPVLKDVSFKVKPGEMLGVVGHSGSGKSTTASLIMRFYDITEGEILIDNIPIQRIKKHCLRRQMGLVAQDPFLFRGTIAENVAYGNPDVSPELLLDAALQANAHMFITRNHDGYDGRLGERGAGLSGGERQRVAIAQALLHNPRVLILDEATSSVDTISEREIQKALEALSHGRTTIAIAHRLSTLRNCDRIMVFEDGEIREQGAHDELMALKGIYRKLVDIQTELASNQPSVDGLQDLKELEQSGGEIKQPERTAPRHIRNTEIPRIHYLEPKKLHCYPLDEGGMRVTYGDLVFERARAYRCFPVSRPNEFIALWTGDTALEHKEIGIIRRLKEIGASSRMTVEHELSKRYFIHHIQEIYSVKENKDNIGYLIWSVKTDKGDRTFITRRWDRHTVQEGGKNGRIIFDIDENRYQIIDLDDLNAKSREEFYNEIYW